MSTHENRDDVPEKSTPPPPGYFSDTTPHIPSRRRGRPPKIQPLSEIAEIAAESAANFKANILAPPQEPGLHTQAVLSVQPVPIQAPTVPSPLPTDEVDLRENPVMAAKHSIDSSGSDSKVRGASDSYLPVEAGTPGLANPALPEQFHGETGTSVKADEQRNFHRLINPQGACPVEPSPSWVPIQSNDVVQINNPQNRLYGALFTVADIKNRRVHGYQLMAGGKHEYITANEDECYRVGQSKVRSRNGCSSKWNAENR